MDSIHKPVMLDEALTYLITDKSGVYFDGTLGFAGHADEFLHVLDNDALYVATEVDDVAFKYCSEHFQNDRRVKLFKMNFSRIDIVTKIQSVEKYDGIFADLGVSSHQLDEPSQGFSYRAETTLDLRLDKSLPQTGSDVLNSLGEHEIADLLYHFGEEKNSRIIARKVVERRIIKPVTSTKDLVEVVSSVTPERFLRKSLSRVFQALRIYVNDEMGMLKEFLRKTTALLKPGGRLVVISYHSIEDRIVKEHIKYEELSCICPPSIPVCVCNKEKRLKAITRKPLLPTETEVENNYRSRSAKMRVAERI